MAIDCTLTAHPVSASNLTTYTFSSQSFGAAATGRYIVALINYRCTTTRTVSTVTIGGVSATIIVQTQQASSCGSAIAIALVESGTTGNVVVTLSGAGQNCGVGVLRVVGLASATAFDTLTDTANALSGTIDCEAGGLIVGTACVAQASTGCSWTNLTEAYDELIESATLNHSGAFDVYGTAQTGLTVTATWGANGTGAAGTFAAFTPTAADGTGAGTADGTGVASGTGASTAAATGTGTAVAAANANPAVIGTAVGTSTVSAVGAGVLTTTGSAAGTATASAVGAATDAGTATSAGLAAAVGAGASIAASIGSIAGTSTVSGVSNAYSAAVGNIAAVATASGIGASTVQAVGTVTGIATAAGISPQFLPHWITFPGQAYLHTNAAPGTSNAKGTLSTWYKHNSNHTAFINAFTTSLTTGRRVMVQWVAGQGLEIKLQDNAGHSLSQGAVPLNINSLTSGAINPEDGNRHWFGISWDTNHSSGTKILQVCIDGTLISFTPLDGGAPAFSVDWTNCIDMAIGANWDPAYSNGKIGEHWLDIGTQIDFSSPTNVALFYNTTAPVDLGADGSTPTGSSPEYYYSLRSGETVSAFNNNRGSGGDLVEVVVSGGSISDGGLIVLSSGVAAGVAIATAVGKSLFAAAGTATGTSTALASGSAGEIGTGIAVGASIATGGLAALAAAAGTAGGVSSGISFGLSVALTVAQSAGIGSASAVGRYFFFYEDDDPTVGSMYADSDPTVGSMYADSVPTVSPAYTDKSP